MSDHFYWYILGIQGALTYSTAVCTPFLLVLTRVMKYPFCLKLMLKKIAMMFLAPVPVFIVFILFVLKPYTTSIKGKEFISLVVHTECHHMACFVSWND